MNSSNPLPLPSDIAGFPFDNPDARITRKNGNILYVVVRKNLIIDGKKIRREIILGRIIDGTYYPMDEYHRLFHRTGRKINDIETPQPVKPGKKNPSRGKRRDGTLMPQPQDIENFPFEIEGARPLVVSGNLYVVTSRFYKTADGKRKEERHYLGRVIEGRYYSRDEYRATFDRYGQRRKIDL